MRSKQGHVGDGFEGEIAKPALHLVDGELSGSQFPDRMEENRHRRLRGWGNSLLRAHWDLT